MFAEKFSEEEKEMLLNMGVDPQNCSDYQILCLPENFEDGSKENLYDANYTSDLSKILKQNGIKCANSYDLGIDSETYERKSCDIHLGLIWVRDSLIVPILASAIYDWLKEKVKDKNSEKEVIQKYAFQEKIIHVYIRFCKGKKIEYECDVKTLKERLEEESKKLE